MRRYCCFLDDFMMTSAPARGAKSIDGSCAAGARRSHARHAIALMMQQQQPVSLRDQQCQPASALVRAMTP
jgi:hypothetical protein